MTLDELLAAVATHHPDADVTPIRAVCDELERRRSEGAALVDWEHALETAGVLAGLGVDPPAVAAAIAAPLALSGAMGSEAVSQAFGAEVASLLGGVRRLAAIRWDRLEEEAAEKLRKAFLAMARDVRVVLVVLAIRVQEMRALRDRELPEEDKRRFARETLEVFAPLANRLGIWQLKWELEDWSLRALDPAAFAEIAQNLAETREQRNAFIESVIAVLRDKLAAEGVHAKVYGRAKHIYSIYKKMRKKGVDVDRVYDVSAVRVITDRVMDCYAALGVVHSLWMPLPGELDDYIAKPKDNGYQSLHTTVVGPGGRPVEVQIRTPEMHQLAELGVAAHWAYKESRKKAPDDRFMVLRQLMDWEREALDAHQFVESLKTDVFEDQVYVFTPGGDVVDLPVGSTPLDFAYRIHTEVGHRCRGARVNDAIQPLDYQLKTGDRVEILTAKAPHPSRDWMNPDLGYLRTASARGKVRAWYRQQGRDSAVQQGKELCDKELGRLDLAHATVEEVAAELDYAKVEDLYAAVGYGDRHPQGVGATALRIEREKSPPSEAPVPPSLPSEERNKSASGLRLDGVDDILGNRARCCNPVPGDDVVGFVSRGRGIVIHRRDCGHVQQSPEPERLVDIEWGPTHEERHRVDIQIRVRDRRGLLRDLTHVISSLGVNVASARAETGKDGSARLRLSLEPRTAEEVVRVLQRIDQLPEVLEVRRIAR